MEAAWGDITSKLKNILITNNTFNNINNVRAAWVTRYTSADPTPSTFSNVQIHNNNFSGVTGVSGIVMKSDYTTAVPDATLNWWGTVVGSEILAKLSGTILYNPWTGMTQPSADNNIPVSVTHDPISLPNSGATIQFSNIGSNNVNPTITVQRFNGVPNTPSSAGTPAPVYLQITATNLANYTFEATIVLDVSSIPGFNANTVVMMSSNGTNGWVASNGTYDANAHTYTFTTNHFTTIAFVNPALSNEVNLYVSTSTSAYGNTVFPNIGWNTPLSTPGDAINWTPSAANHDWTYKVKTGTYYIVPVGATSSPRSFNAATIKVVWNPSLVSGINITEGNFFNNGGQMSLFTTNRGSNWVIIDASCLTQNQTPGSGKFIAQLDFTFNKDTSGFSAIAIDAVTLLYMDGSNEYEVTTVTQNMGGKLKFYLGDFASTSPLSQDIGDGLIDGTDLNGFSTAYWSNYNDVNTLYKSKYDVGPTTPTRYYFGKPVPDGTIGFEDLAIFSMGYSKTASHSLPDNPNQKPIRFALDNIQKDGNGILRLPVKIYGGVNDLRALSMKIKYGSDMEYRGVEMAGEMLEGTKFLIGKSESGKVFMDGAVIGAFESGLSKEGIIAYVLFNEKQSGNHNASIENVIARNSENIDLEVQYDGMNNGVGIPTTYSLNQNYPNPFNPVTKIEYALPKDVKVMIKVYDVLGREMQTLVNEVKKAGYYSVEWNGSSLSSGVYFYQIKAGDYNAVKKMMLIK